MMLFRPKDKCSIFCATKGILVNEKNKNIKSFSSNKLVFVNGKRLLSHY